MAEEQFAFVACATCARRFGEDRTPVFCDSCIANSRTITALEERLSEQARVLKGVTEQRDAWQRECVTARAAKNAVQYDSEALEAYRYFVQQLKEIIVAMGKRP